MRDHVVICGYGTKGRNAARALRLQGHPPERIVVIETDPAVAADATAVGLVAVVGSADRADVLRSAHVERARAVIVAASVIVSAETAGRLLGLAAESPSDLGLPVLAAVRDGRTLRYSDPEAATLAAGDQIVFARA